jgi:hypothetical protein
MNTFKLPFGLLLPKEEIQLFIQEKGHYKVAQVLFKMGIPFEATYEAIFNQLPRD